MGKEYDDPLREITDLAGVRVITYFPSDVDQIVKEIEENFVIDKENSIDKRNISDPSSFGYVSVHLIVELFDDRLKLPEYSLFKEMKCEIQVRTILQHAWAEIEHDIVYKSTEEIPFELRRNFSSLAGLLEVADREFELIRKMEKEVSKKIEIQIDTDELDIPIDLESSTCYLKKSRNESNDSLNVSELIKFIQSKSIMTIRELDQILTSERLSKADDYLTGVKCNSKKDCLLRYYLVIGYYFNSNIKEISKAASCDDLIIKKGKIKSVKLTNQRK